jgi:CelD/BcsL family acetyltransferase involved in cellulose biosynthesis
MAGTALPLPAARKAGTAKIQVEIIDDFQSFLDLERVWNDVFDAAACDCPFLEHAWVRTWWECFGIGSRLQILLLKAGGRAIAIVPLIATSIRMWGAPVTRLGFLYNSHVPRADFIIAERQEDVYEAAWKHLSHDRRWDLLQLCQIVEGSRTLETISRLAGADQYPFGIWPSEASPYIPLHTTSAEYFGGLAAKHRSNLRNRFKRLETVGPVEVEEITSSEGLAEALDRGLRIEASAWKAQAGTAIVCDGDIARFYAVFGQRAAERGWLRLQFLRAGAERVAFDYSLYYKGRIYLLKIGYDPAYAPYSPSNLLVCRVLQGAFEEGCTEYDFLGASDEWKMCWARQARMHYWLFVFSRNLKGRLLHIVKFGLVPVLRRKRLQGCRTWLLGLRSRYLQFTAKREVHRT